LMLPLEPPGSAEFTVTVLSLCVGLVTIGVIAFAIRKLSR